MTDEYISKQDAVDVASEDGKKIPTVAIRIMHDIKALSPADVAPVVHAYWIRHENADMFDGYEVPMFECSKCRAWKEDDSDFCPDCGAKMDTQGEET